MDRNIIVNETKKFINEQLDKINKNKNDNISKAIINNEIHIILTFMNERLRIELSEIDNSIEYKSFEGYFRK
jgi:hypothetical protein